MRGPRVITLGGALLATALAAVADDNQWNFTALLDGKPIGEHRFSVQGPGPQRRVRSEADFSVRLLGVVVYRYRHRADESWRGDCLTGLQASTDDDGDIRWVRLGEAFGTPLAGCVMSFAYWNTAIRGQTRLLNAQTGEVETVQLRRLGDRTIEVRGSPMAATRWRISGTAQPIDIWYSVASDEWVGLDSTVRGGRQLSYRLK